MKSKVLSLILAITLLCGIMVPTAAFAEVNKGDEIVLLKADFTVGLASYVVSSEQTLPGKTDLAQCIGGANGPTVEKSYYTIVPTIDLAEPFTFEFEYWAKSGVKSFFSFESGTDLLTTSETGSVSLNGSVVSNVTAPFEAWNTVVFNYDGTQYGVYLNGILLGDKFTLDAIGANFRIGTDTQTFPSGTNWTLLCFDEIYAYEGAYEPEVSEEPTTTVLFDDFEDVTITATNVTFALNGVPKVACSSNTAFGDTDQALVFTTNQGALDKSITSSFYQKSTTLYDNEKVTFEVDIFKDNILKPVSVSVKYHPVGYSDDTLGTFTFAKFMNNGTITSQDYGVKEDGATGAIYLPIATYAPNRWYKVAATYDKETQTMNVYINGELLLEGAEFPFELDKIGAQFTVAEEHTPYDGVVPASILAVDNYGISLGAYDTTGESAKVTSDALSGNTIYVEDAYDKTVADVNDLISYGEGVAVKFYADDTYATELTDEDTIDASTVLVATSPNGNVREYYTFKAKDTIELTENSTTGLATASVYLSEASKDHMLVIAAYSEDNELLAVTVNNALTTEALASANVSLTDAALIKAFVWTANNQPTGIIKTLP